MAAADGLIQPFVSQQQQQPLWPTGSEISAARCNETTFQDYPDDQADWTNQGIRQNAAQLGQFHQNQLAQQAKLNHQLGSANSTTYGARTSPVHSGLIGRRPLMGPHSRSTSAEKASASTSPGSAAKVQTINSVGAESLNHASSKYPVKAPSLRPTKLADDQDARHQIEQVEQVEPVEAEAEVEGDHDDGDDGDDNHEDAGEDEDEKLKMSLLKKSSFCCMLVGARQTGKKSIVKCFVKLLNEFKLALEEYRKEKMLTRLMDCSERLQALSDEQEERLRLQALSDQQLNRRPSSYDDHHHHHHGNKTWQRARGNSWLSGSPIDRWLRLPSISAADGAKRRLNSLVAGASGHLPALLVSGSDALNQAKRRHTTVEHAECLKDLKQNQSDPFKSSQDGFLSVGDALKNKLHSSCNKSDFNIDYYQETNEKQSIEMQPLSLNVPSTSLSNQSQRFAQRAGSTRDLADGVSTTTYKPDSSSEALATKRSMQFLSPSPPNTAESSSCNTNNQQQMIMMMASPHRTRTQSIQARRKPILSLKELNKRRIRIKFRSRRQVSDKYITSSQQPPTTTTSQKNNPPDKNKNSQLASEEEKLNCFIEFNLPDLFMVVYSVNDR